MAIQFAEGAVTKLRQEFKLLLAEHDAVELCQRLQRELGAPSPLPTIITSIYFDRPGCPLARRAWATPDDCLKVRTKEYAPDVGGGAEDRVVFEVKREHHGMTRKRRLWVPRPALRGVLGRLPQEEVAVAPGAPLAPVLAVSYLRVVYQRDAAYRVTVDRDIRFHPVDEAIALSPRRVGRAELPEARGREERVIVEVKHLGARLPQWLELLGAARRERYSKFASGMDRLWDAGQRIEGHGG